MVIKSQKNIIDFIINISHRIKDKKIESKFIAKKGVEKNEVQNI